MVVPVWQYVVFQFVIYNIQDNRGRSPEYSVYINTVEIFCCWMNLPDERQVIFIQSWLISGIVSFKKLMWSKLVFKWIKKCQYFSYGNITIKRLFVFDGNIAVCMRSWVNELGLKYKKNHNISVWKWNADTRMIFRHLWLAGPALFDISRFFAKIWFEFSWICSFLHDVWLAWDGKGFLCEKENKYLISLFFIIF